MKVLPTDTQKALQASVTSSESSSFSAPSESSESSSGSSGGSSSLTGDVVRLIYETVTTGTKSPGTMLNTILGAPELTLEPTAIWEDGLRKKLTSSSLTGEYYILGGKIYNNFEILSGSRLILEVLTIV